VFLGLGCAAKTEVKSLVIMRCIAKRELNGDVSGGNKKSVDRRRFILS